MNHQWCLQVLVMAKTKYCTHAEAAAADSFGGGDAELGSEDSPAIWHERILQTV